MPTQKIEFIWKEDRDPETGHGWRDREHQILIDPHNPKDGGFVTRIAVYSTAEDGTAVREEDEWDSGRPPECSYAWICPKEYWDKHHHIEDNIRSSHLRAHWPGFKGSDDMGSHFEFRMTPNEMRKYLTSLGFIEFK